MAVQFVALLCQYDSSQLNRSNHRFDLTAACVACCRKLSLKVKVQWQECASSACRDKFIRRSQSAVELRSLGLPRHASEMNLKELQQVTVELTTPEGHVYKVGRMSNEERAQKILKSVPALAMMHPPKFPCSCTSRLHVDVMCKMTCAVL